MTEKGQDILIGIDLGTSQSAISTSTGEKHVVDSYVGWPVDAVARKILKKDVLFGAEAVENRTMLDLHRPLERGLLKEGSEKDQQAIRELLGHLMELAGVSDRAQEGRQGPGRRRRPRRGAPGQQAARSRGDARFCRWADHRLRALCRRLRSRRPAPRHRRRRRRRDHRFLRHAGPLPHRGGPTDPDQRRRLDRRTARQAAQRAAPRHQRVDPHRARLEGNLEFHGQGAQPGAGLGADRRQAHRRSTSPKRCGRPARPSAHRWRRPCSTSSPRRSRSTRNRSATT